MRRVLVTGGETPLAQRLIEALAAHESVEWVRGITTRESAAKHADVDLLAFVPDHRPLSEYLERERIDTVVQCDLAPDRSGRARGAQEANVIGTMCLGAAVGTDGSPVRSWVLASSSTVYPIGSHSGLIQSEADEVASEEGSPAASIVEAEDYARDVAQRIPHLSVAILRLQHIAGESFHDSLASVLGRTLVPTPIGFDPGVQLLHIDDAVGALVFAAVHELAGLYNVASSGIVNWSEAVEATGRTAIPVLPLSPGPVESLASWLRIPHLPGDVVDLLRFGHAIDSSKLQRAGWTPEHEQAGCLALLRAG